MRALHRKPGFSLTATCSVWIVFAPALAARIGGACRAAPIAAVTLQATYTARTRCYLYTGQKIPGTQTKADRDGWYESPTSDSGHALFDGDLDWQHSLRTHFWSQQDKQIEVNVNLGSPRRIDRIEIVLSTDRQQGNGIDHVTIHWGSKAAVSEDMDGPLRFSRPAAENWEGALGFSPAPALSPGAVIRSPQIGQTAQFLRIQCDSRQPIVVIGEIAIREEDRDERVPATGRDGAGPMIHFRPVPRITLVKTGRLSPAYDWICREKIRGMYGYVGDRRNGNLLDRIVAAGFNTMLVHTMGPTAMSETGWIEEAQAWATVARNRSLHVIVSWPFGSDERYGNTQFGAYHPGTSGVWTKTPCPLSEAYWNRVIGDRAVVAANAGLAGLVVDPEMYGADHTAYVGPCYCDRCWSRYVDAHVEGVEGFDARAVPASQRVAWAQRHVVGLDYQRWQELSVRKILADVRSRVRTVRPDFLLGNLAGIEFSVPGMADGFGTPQMPALVFGEREYKGRDDGGWYNVSGLPDRVENLRKRHSALYVTGLWPRYVTPPNIPRVMGKLVLPYAGYWIWSTAAFQDDASGDAPLGAGFSRDDYWIALGEANRAMGAR